MKTGLQDKNSHSLYLSNEAMQMAAELCELLGLSGRSQAFEVAIRAMHNARSAQAYQIAYEQARRDIQRGLDSPYDSTE
jgi:hypothetical protein